MRVSAQEMASLAMLIGELCGLVLDPTKEYLVESRLGPLAREVGCVSFSDLCRRARADVNVARAVIDAITTQETLFFRDEGPFAALQHRMAPDCIDARGRTARPKRLRLWSAAASTGQEPYSLAIILLELLPDIDTRDVSILATDICDAAITYARRGVYSNLEVKRGMRPDLLQRHFTRQEDGWRVNDRVRSLVKFERRNLLQPFDGLEPFDVIFCRNVAIYFAPAVQTDLFNRLADLLVPGGYLVAGCSEALHRHGDRFHPLHRCGGVVYRPGFKTSSLAA